MKRYFSSFDDKLKEKFECQMANVNLDRISFIIQKTNRSWMRDSGPIVIKTESNGSFEFQF
jgi:agmatine deiminase